MDSITNRGEKHVDMPACLELVRAMATSIKNTIHHYWFSRKDAEHAIAQCHHQLDAILDKSDELIFVILDKKLTLNKRNVDEPGSTYLAMIDHLVECGIENFTLLKGVSLADFAKFMQILSSSTHALNAGGGFTKVIADAQLQHIVTRKVILREVAEFEVVVNQSEVGGGGGAGSAAPPPQPQDTANILAFLKGDVSTPDKDTADRINKLASDAEKMAELIMQAVSIRRADHATGSPEMLTDFVVGCLRRTSEAMSGNKAVQTNTGKKKFVKNLLLLEEQVLKRMRETSSAWSDEDLSRIAGSVERLTADTELDRLAEEVATKRHACEKSEEQLVKLLKTRGVQDVSDIGSPEKLSGDGIGLQGWHELLLKTGGAGGGSGTGNGQNSPDAASSGTGTGDSAVGAAGPARGGSPLGALFEAISHLETLLDTMEKSYEKSDDLLRKQNGEKLMQAFRDVNVAVHGIVADVSERIREVLAAVKEDGESVRIMEENAKRAGLVLKHPRREILGTLTCIMRQISEPLALVDSSLEMVLSKTMGGVTVNQNTLLTLARENVGRISDLMKDLETIGNTPNK